MRMRPDRSWPEIEGADSWRDRSLEERALAIESACRAAMQILEGSPDRERRLSRGDPLPPSTLDLLRRLARG